jgi:hypothetical protein
MKRLHESPVPIGEAQNVNPMNFCAISSNDSKKSVVGNTEKEECNSSTLVNPIVHSIKSMPFFTHPNSAFRPVVPKGDSQKEFVHKVSTPGQRREKPSVDNDRTYVFVPIKPK